MCSLFTDATSKEIFTGNDYKQAHNDSRSLIKNTGTPIDLRVDLEDYDRCVDLLNDTVLVFSILLLYTTATYKIDALLSTLRYYDS